MPSRKAKKPVRCSAKTKPGNRCTRSAIKGGRCGQHQAKKAKKVIDNRLTALAAGARNAPAGNHANEIVRANTPTEMHELAQRQDALIKTIGRRTWNAMQPREQVAMRCVLLERGNVTRAAMRAGLGRSYYYQEGRSEAFKQAMDHAELISNDLVEHDIVRRGTHGAEKVVRYRGMPVPITDPRVPAIINPETKEPYMVPSPHNPEVMLVFRGYELEIEYSDGIGLHVLKSRKPEIYNKPPTQRLEVKQQAASPTDLVQRIASQVGIDVEDLDDIDDLDQAYKLKD